MLRKGCDGPEIIKVRKLFIQLFICLLLISLFYLGHDNFNIHQVEQLTPTSFVRLTAKNVIGNALAFAEVKIFGC
jgi:hypothetical protein